MEVTATSSNNIQKSFIGGEEAVYCPIVCGLIPKRCCPTICQNKLATPNPYIPGFPMPDPEHGWRITCSGHWDSTKNTWVLD